MDGERDGSTYSVQRLRSGISVVHASGDLDGNTHSGFHHAVVSELRRRPLQLVLEFSRVTSADDAVLRTLSVASAVAGEYDIALCLVAPSVGPVAKMLAAAELAERFEIVATIDEAVGHRYSSELRTVRDGTSPNS